MIDGALELALGNVPVSLALTGLAYAVHRHGRYPALAHLLWVIVLIKVMTPPLLVLSVPLAAPAGVSGGIVAATSTATTLPGLAERVASLVGQVGPSVLVLTWALGSLIATAISVRRMRAFGQLLTRTSVDAPPAVERLAERVGHELGLRSIPPVFVTAASISPMTWWSGGRIRLVLPQTLLQRSDPAELRWVLAHELAHVKRRDHLVRWIEWLATVAFWWNPLVWYARRNLRLDEEDACDALVVGRLEGPARAYASALLDAVEVLSQPHGRVPAVATGIDAARSLEHRLRAIVAPDTGVPAPRPLAVGVTAAAVLALTVGVGSGHGATAPDAAGSDGIENSGVAVITGEPTPDSAGYATVSATLSSGPPAGRTFVGSADGDTYAGSAGNDDIRGLAGADHLDGRAGRDVIRGGAGPDVIRGGAGPDELHGGAGADTIYSWTDGTPDRIDCGDGQDRAVIDSTDTARACEDVVVRDPS